jgi:hypothetical protein
VRRAAPAASEPREARRVEPDPRDRCTVAGNSEGVAPFPATSDSGAGAASEPGMGDLYAFFDREGGGE